MKGKHLIFSTIPKTPILKDHKRPKIIDTFKLGDAIYSIRLNQTHTFSFKGNVFVVL